MRVLQVINSLCAGGAEVFVGQLARELKKYCDVELFLFYGILDEKGVALDTMLKEVGIQPIVPGYVSPGFAKRILCPAQVSSTVSAIKPDVVHVHLDQCEMYTYLGCANKKRDHKFVRTIHNAKRSERVPRLFWKKIDEFYDCSVHCSKDAAHDYVYMGSSERYITINNGIILPPVVQSRTRDCCSSEETVFLNIGSFNLRHNCMQKGQDIIIKALSEITADNIRVVFVGDGSELQSMKNLADVLGVADKIDFVGRVSDPYEYINMSDFLVMPSRFEGLPVSAIEGVCAGLPLLASNISSFDEFDLDSTVRYSKDSVGELAGAMCHAMLNREVLVKKARENSLFYRSRFDMRSVAEKYYELYRRLLMD